MKYSSTYWSRFLPSVLFRAFSFMLLALCFSCEKGEQWDCIKSTGEIIREERMVGTFNTIHIDNNINIVFTSDTSGKVIVEAGDNLLKEIKTEVTNGMLNIRNENTCNWVRSYKKLITVYVGIRKNILDYSFGNLSTDGQLSIDTIFVHHYSSGDIHLNLKSNYIWLDADKLGKFTLEGETERVNAIMLSLAHLHTTNLKCKDFYISNEGGGNCYITSTNLLYAAIKGKGNVYYFGNPASVYTDKTGEGSLIKGD